MSSLALGIAKYLKLSITTRTVAPFATVVRGSSTLYSTASFGSDNDVDDVQSNENDYDDFLPYKPELEIQSEHPKRGWVFRGVRKLCIVAKNDGDILMAILCGKIGQAPAQRILRGGQTVTMFTVGTGGMFDQKILGAKDLPKPAQWHRIVVHNVALGAYAVHQLVKNSSVYVEGNIETRVYNDSRNGEVKNIPEICVRHDGRIRLIKAGESGNSISLDELHKFSTV